jgi:hypothetical protein
LKPDGLLEYLVEGDRGGDIRVFELVRGPSENRYCRNREYGTGFDRPYQGGGRGVAAQLSAPAHHCNAPVASLRRTPLGQMHQFLRPTRKPAAVLTPVVSTTPELPQRVQATSLQ